MKRLIILQLLSIIFMVLGLAALLYYQKLTKLEEQEKTKSKKTITDYFSAFTAHYYVVFFTLSHYSRCI